MIEDFDAPNGKFANNFGNVVVIDSKYFIDELIESVRDNLSAISGGDVLTAFLNNVDLFGILDRLTINDYAIQVDVGKLVSIKNVNNFYYFIYSSNTIL